MINISTFKSVFANHFRVGVEEFELHYEVTLSDRYSELSFRGSIRKSEDPMNVIRDFDQIFDIENEFKRYENTFINMSISDYKFDGVNLSFEILDEIKNEWDWFYYGKDRLLTNMVCDLCKVPSNSLCL